MPESKAEQTPEQIYANVKLLNQMFGGIVLEE